ncbi:type II secretion system F family protein [Streptomyces polyrhachis]|uniref:Type II secretion system F family protein n=1 Tax=Streptomyces polyrhachis TaxID=1282885 RepID=A0ABW2GBG3_9ACTN
MSTQLMFFLRVLPVSLCAGAAAWLVTAGRPVLPRARRMLTGAPVRRARLPEWGRVAVARLRGRPEWWCLPVGALIAVLGHSWLPLPVGLLAVPLVGRRLAARRRTREEERRGLAVIALCGAVAGGLRAGQQPTEALLASAASERGAGVEVLAAARFGGDVPQALRRAARVSGADGLKGVAACWQVAADGGAGLAEGLDRVAAALRAEHRRREELRAEMAGPRSTALLLAVLPLVGLLIGSAIGAAPLKVLLHTPAGLACLALGAALEWAGLAWTARIVGEAA